MKAKRNGKQIHINVPEKVFAFIRNRAITDIRSMNEQTLFYLLKGVETDPEWRAAGERDD